jgi:hypothetical protein
MTVFGQGGGFRLPAHTQRSLVRLDRVLEASGDIFFGDDLTAQLAVAGSRDNERLPYMPTLRFRCTAAVFAFLREGVQRFPIEATRLSLPLPTDRWWRHSKAPHVLPPLPGNSHPYPVEIDLPIWTLAHDVDRHRLSCSTTTLLGADGWWNCMDEGWNWACVVQAQK